MPLAEFIATVKDGDEHGWQTELAYLWFNHRDRLGPLIADIRANGITEPIHIGVDGRCWDGHHRIAAAAWIGLREIPVKDDRTLEDAPDA